MYESYINHGVLKFSIQKLKKKIQKIPRNDVDLKERAKKFHTDDVLLPRSASDWLCRERNLLQPIRRTTQIWVVNRHQDEISAPVPEYHFVSKLAVVRRREIPAVFSG